MREWQRNERMEGLHKKRREVKWRDLGRTEATQAITHSAFALFFSVFSFPFIFIMGLNHLSSVYVYSSPTKSYSLFPRLIPPPTPTIISYHIRLHLHYFFQSNSSHSLFCISLILFHVLCKNNLA